MGDIEGRPAAEASAVEWARYWQRFGLAVGPFTVTAKPGGGYNKRPADGLHWRADKPGRWFRQGAPLEDWRPDWRAVGFHLGRSRVVCLDIDAPEGHPGKGLRPILEQIAAISAMIGAVALERPALLWQTASGGYCLVWFLPDGAPVPPSRLISVPGLPHPVELRSGEAVAVLPHGGTAAPVWRLLAAPLPPAEAPPLPPALWAALTAPQAGASGDADRLEPGADAPAGRSEGESRRLEVRAAADADRVAAVARFYDDPHQAGPLQWRAVCPCCAKLGKTDRRLAIGLDAAGRVMRRCRGRCSLGAIRHARPVPDALIFPAATTAPGAPIDPTLAADLGRFRFAAKAAAAGHGLQGRIDWAILEAMAYAAALAGALEFSAAQSTIGLHAHVAKRSMAGKDGAIARVLSRYPDLVQRITTGDIEPDGIPSSVYRLTPPAAGPALEAAPILPGGNAARALSVSDRGRSERGRALVALGVADGPQTPAMLAPRVEPNGVTPSTMRRYLVDFDASGLACRVDPPPLERRSGRPPSWYEAAPKVRAAVQADDVDAALAELLPEERRGRFDRRAEQLTADRRRLVAAHADGGVAGAQRAIARRDTFRRLGIARAKDARRLEAERRRLAAAALAVGAATVQPAPAADDIAAAVGEG